MNSYIPHAIALLRAWLLNFFNKIGTHGLAVGRTAPQIITDKALAQQGMDKIDAVVATKAAQKAAVHDLQDWMKSGGSGLAVLRLIIDLIKANPGCTSLIAEDLGAVSPHETFDAVGYQPTGTAVAQAGYVLVNFEKLGVDLMCINYRLKGETVWNHIGDLKISGYHHVFSLPVVIPPVLPVVRSVVLEYQLIGILHDHAIGHPSDLIVCTFEL